MKKGIERIDNTTTIPETWAKLTESHILRSQGERARSQDLRADIAKALDECANDMWQAWNSVNAELSRRVQETTEGTEFISEFAKFEMNNKF